MGSPRADQTSTANLGGIHATPSLTESLLVKDAVFLATWTLEHVIATNPGGIAGPFQMAAAAAKIAPFARR
jgi:hypothetical protein